MDQKTAPEDPFWAKDPGILVHPSRLLEFFPASWMTPRSQLNAIARFCIYGTLLLLAYTPDARVLFVGFLGLFGTWMVDQGWVPLREGFWNRYRMVPPVETLDEVEDELAKKGAHLGFPSALDDPSEPPRPFSARPAAVRSFGADRPMQQPTVWRGADVRVAPTQNNPYMNVLVSDLADDPGRPAACNLYEKDVLQTAEKHAQFNLYQDVGDLFGNLTSTRSFYTMPSTTIPNDQNAYARWLFGDVNKGCKGGNLERCVPYQDGRIDVGRIEDNMSSLSRTVVPSAGLGGNSGVQPGGLVRI